MSVVFQTKTDPVWASNSGQTVTLPASTAAGDLLVLSIAVGIDADRFVDPSGWTNIFKVHADTGLGSNGALAVYWKIATSGDVSAGNMAYTLTSSSINAGGIKRYTGHSSGSPIANSKTLIQGSNSGSWHVPGFIPPTNCLFESFTVYSNDIGTNAVAITTSDPGFSEDWDVTTTLSTDFATSNYRSALRSQITDTGDVVVTPAGSINGVAGVIAIQPPISSVSLSPSSSTSASPSNSPSASTSLSPSASASPSVSSSPSASLSVSSSVSLSVSKSPSSSASSSPSPGSSVSSSLSSSISKSPSSSVSLSISKSPSSSTSKSPSASLSVSSSISSSVSASISESSSPSESISQSNSPSPSPMWRNTHKHVSDWQNPTKTQNG